MRLEQIIATVARVFAIVEVRTNRAVEVSAVALRLHSWQLLMGHRDDRGYCMPSCLISDGKPVYGKTAVTAGGTTGQLRLAFVPCKPPLTSSWKPSC